MTSIVRIASLACFVILGLVFSSPAHADSKADAKAFIAKQVEQIKKGDIAALKAGFTKRQQDRVTAESVAKGKKELDTMTIDDLVDSVTAEKDAIKIKMKNGRTLTTLLKVDGKWLADTIWFR